MNDKAKTKGGLLQDHIIEEGVGEGDSQRMKFKRLKEAKEQEEKGLKLRSEWLL